MRHCGAYLAKKSDKETMRIYKFKDLNDESKHSHFLQIALNKSIWCAAPDSLDDEDEFKFALDYTPSPRTSDLLAEVVARYGTVPSLPPQFSAAMVLEHERLKLIASPIINNAIAQCRAETGITSFSAAKTDRLWRDYGGNGYGVCVEIDIPDQLLGRAYHRVNYVPTKIFHVDSFLESALYPDRTLETYRNMLLTKTMKWAPQEEIRFIGNRQNVNLIFDGRVTEITFGYRVPANTRKTLEAVIADHCRSHGIRLGDR
jgi:hypothetical protein